jgi:hypothetical protein
MRDRDPVTEPRRAEALAGQQGVGDLAALDAVAVLEEEAGLFEESLLARYREIDQHVARCQQPGDSVHLQSPRMRKRDLRTARGRIKAAIKGL